MQAYLQVIRQRSFSDYKIEFQGHKSNTLFQSPHIINVNAFLRNLCNKMCPKHCSEPRQPLKITKIVP